MILSTCQNESSYLLQVLELDNCSLLTSVSLDLPRLQNIRLVHCRKYILLLHLISPISSNLPKKETPSLSLVEIVLFPSFGFVFDLIFFFFPADLLI